MSPGQSGNDLLALDTLQAFVSGSGTSFTCWLQDIVDGSARGPLSGVCRWA